MEKIRREIDPKGVGPLTRSNGGLLPVASLLASLYVLGGVRNKRIPLFFLSFISMILMACSTIPPYSVVVSPPKQTLLPPSFQLAKFTDETGLSAQLERTTTYCGEVKQAIAREIDQRERRLITRRTLLMVIGSVAALTSTVYAGVEEDPSKDVTVPLGAVSGSALLAALPSLGKDERAEALREKLAAIKTKETAAITAWNALEGQMLGVSLLEDALKRAKQDASTEKELRDALNKKYFEVEPIEEQLRAALAALANECS